MIYYINIALILIETFLFKKDLGQNSGFYNDKENNRFLFITCLQHVLIFSLRKIPEYGDLNTYCQIFEWYKNRIDPTYLEPGFRLLNKLLALTHMSDHLYITILGTVTILLYYRFIKENSENVYFSVLIFSCFMTYFFIFNGLRQALAMAIVLQGVKPLLDGKYIKFIVAILIGVSFHYVSLIFILLFVFRFVSFKPGVSAFFCLIAIGVIFSIILRPILNIAIGSGHYGTTLSNESFGGSGTFLNPFLYLLIFFMVNIFLNYDLKRCDYFFYNMLAFATIIYMFSLQVSIMNRVTYYFTPSSMILIPKICNEQKTRENKNILLGFFYTLVILYGIILIARNGNGILPYELFWR